jgi:hypothetical protein
VKVDRNACIDNLFSREALPSSGTLEFLQFIDVNSKILRLELMQISIAGKGSSVLGRRLG